MDAARAQLPGLAARGGVGWPGWPVLLAALLSGGCVARPRQYIRPPAAPAVASRILTNAPARGVAARRVPAGANRASRAPQDAGVYSTVKIKPFSGATSLTERLNWGHESAYILAQHQINRVDDWFVDPAGKRKPVPPGRFRLGLGLDLSSTPSNRFGLAPLFDSDIHITVPNIQERTRLVLSTYNPLALPGQSQQTASQNLRLAVRKSWLDLFDTSVGVKVKWPPVVYGYATWGPSWRAGDWGMFPNQQFGWESDNGFSETTGILFNRWIRHWLMRSSSSLRWSQEQYRNDRDALAAAEAFAITNHLPVPLGGYWMGWEWEQDFVTGYASELIEQDHWGQVVDGRDIAHGGTVRFSIYGSLHTMSQYQLALLYSFPIHERWIYFRVSPQISWQSQYEWQPDYDLKFGVDLYFWGGESR